MVLHGVQPRPPAPMCLPGPLTPRYSSAALASGLTDRPIIPRHDTPLSLDSNPYGLKFQALLTLQLSSALGLERIVLAGHDDGALLALMAAAMACREQALGSPIQPLLDVGGGETPPPRAQSSSDGLASGGGRMPPASAAHAVPLQGASRHRRYGSVGSLPDSLDWGWMSSHQGHSVLQKLLKGEWPASIDPRTAFGASALATSSHGRPPGAWRSPARPHLLGRPHLMGLRRQLGSLEPFQEQEEASGAPTEHAHASGAALDQLAQVPPPGQAQPQANGMAASSSTEQGGTRLSGMLIDNPSFLSQVSMLPCSLSLPCLACFRESAWHTRMHLAPSHHVPRPTVLCCRPAIVSSGRAAGIACRRRLRRTSCQIVSRRSSSRVSMRSSAGMGQYRSSGLLKETTWKRKPF